MVLPLTVILWCVIEGLVSAACVCSGFDSSCFEASFCAGGCGPLCCCAVANRAGNVRNNAIFFTIFNFPLRADYSIVIAPDNPRHVASPHDLLSTRYELGKQIARGGTAIVYEAWDRHLTRRVALKIIDTRRAGADFDDILQEAKTLARLEHSGIVPIYDAGRLADGRLYYVMRLVHGEQLGAFFAREKSLFERLRVFQKVCDTLAFAHESGVIHRGLNPQNVLAGKFGEVFVIDWGLAEWLAPEGQAEALYAAGPPRYIAPEQAGERPEPVDGRADVFSLGAMLQDLLREGESRPLAAIARKALAPNPIDRYQHVEHLTADLVRFLDHLPVTAYDKSLLERTGQFAARHRVLLLILAVYALVRVMIFLLSGS